MQDIIDSYRYPIDQLEHPKAQEILAYCHQQLTDYGVVSLPGLLHKDCITRILAEATPLFVDQAFTHQRSHNVFFLPEVPGLAPEHPALMTFETTNHTLVAKQLPDSPLTRLYEWEALRDFLALVMQKPKLYMMDDPLARMNVMAYHHDEALNWHFDRSEFTITLLLQAPLQGGEFEYRIGLRDGTYTDYDAVGRFLQCPDKVNQVPLEAGTLTIFKGQNTLHRVAPVVGERARIVATLSYYENPGVRFSDAENKGFYGQTNALVTN